MLTQIQAIKTFHNLSFFFLVAIRLQIYKSRVSLYRPAQFIEQVIHSFSFFYRNAAEAGIELMRMIVEVIKQAEPFFGDGNVNQPAIIFADPFFYKFFFYEPVHDAARIAHFIQHALPYLHSG